MSSGVEGSSSSWLIASRCSPSFCKAAVAFSYATSMRCGMPIHYRFFTLNRHAATADRSPQWSHSSTARSIFVVSDSLSRTILTKMYHNLFTSSSSSSSSSSLLLGGFIAYCPTREVVKFVAQLERDLTVNPQTSIRHEQYRLNVLLKKTPAGLKVATRALPSAFFPSGKKYIHDFFLSHCMTEYLNNIIILYNDYYCHAGTSKFSTKRRDVKLSLCITII